jgi:hypothetical protein
VQAAESRPIATPVHSSSSVVRPTITPEQLRPFPKATPRKTTIKHVKKGRTRILTDTPVKDEIEQVALSRKRAKEFGGEKPRSKKRLLLATTANPDLKQKSQKKHQRKSRVSHATLNMPKGNQYCLSVIEPNEYRPRPIIVAKNCIVLIQA